MKNMKAKTMKTLSSLIAGLRPASSIFARRMALPLLLLGAGLTLVQPCAGAPFQFEPTGSLRTARYGHTATLLPNGKVLVAGGRSSNASPLASAELYDQATGKWRTTGSLANARSGHTATLLPNGKVLVAGGCAGLASAELYEPASGTWTATGSLANVREFHTATLLSNGKVLVAGGLDTNGHALAGAELYDPMSGTWTATGASLARAQITRRRCCPTARCSSQAAVSGQRLSRERRTLRSGERDLGGHRQPRYRSRATHGELAAQRQGACRRRTRRRPPSRARNSTIRRAGPGRRPAASLPRAQITRRRCCPMARCS